MIRCTARLVFAAAMLLAAAPGLAQTPAAQAPAAPPAPVWPEKGSTITGEAIAWDGDTIEIAGQAIRLHGIDAPEMSGDARGPVARGALDDILAPDRTVTCEAVDMDRYKRPVARCRAGGRDLAEAIVLAGWAFSFRKYSTDYDAAEAEARAAGRGFWATNNTKALTWMIPVMGVLAVLIAGGLPVWQAHVHRRSDERARIEDCRRRTENMTRTILTGCNFLANAMQEALVTDDNYRRETDPKQKTRVQANRSRTLAPMVIDAARLSRILETAWNDLDAVDPLVIEVLSELLLRLERATLNAEQLMEVKEGIDLGGSVNILVVDLEELLENLRNSARLVLDKAREIEAMLKVPE